MYNKIKRIHLVGIGGIGMSSLAEILLKQNFIVSGSDQKINDTIRRLQTLGIDFCMGHEAQTVSSAELVVVSSAISEENAEVLEAQRKGIPVIPRAEMLAELMRMKYGIAIAGAHGKTTTTSMIASILIEGKVDPTVMVGGKLKKFGGTNAHIGNGEFMVAEADESDGSFHRLSPSIAVVTNLDREHLDYFKTMRNLRESFLSFLNKVPFYGLSVLCGDDPQLRLIYPEIMRRKVTYGFQAHNTYQILEYTPQDKGVRFVFQKEKSEREKVELPLFGRHNALNALAALCVADELSIDRETALLALSSFSGVDRRFEIKGEINGVILVDDYAHHPSEITATLSAARERFSQKKISVLFQPHRYSRVKDLFDEFSESLLNADRVMLTPIYAASEKPIPGISSELMADNMKRLGFAEIETTTHAKKGHADLIAQSQAGDVVLTLGAGDLPQVYQDLL